MAAVFQRKFMEGSKPRGGPELKKTVVNHFSVSHEAWEELEEDPVIWRATLYKDTDSLEEKTRAKAETEKKFLLE